MRVLSDFGNLGQTVLPADFDKLSPEEKVKFIDSLPPDLKQKALLELYFKLPIEKQREWIEVYKNASQYDSDVTTLLITTLGSFAFDTFVFVPSVEKASGAARLGAYAGSTALSGVMAYTS